VSKLVSQAPNIVKAKPAEVPREVARRFVNAAKDFFAEKDSYKRDAIAAHQLSVLQQYQGAREAKLRFSDIKAMFEQMRDQL
jgi:hypothetical protein